MSKSSRQDNVHTDIFTPRPYQVELLEAALKTNTIVCLGSGTGKTFIGVMVIKELAHELRMPLAQGGKRTVMLVDNATLMEQQAKVVQIHTDLAVAMYPDVSPDLLERSQLDSEMSENQVVILTAHMFLEVLRLGFVNLSYVNLLICDECHLALGEGHPYVEIMKHYGETSQESRPRILAVTASVLNKDCISPEQLQSNISALEAIFHSTAETASDILLADLFAARPKEFVLDCDAYVDETGLVSTFAYMIESLLEFVEDTSIPDFEDLPRNPRRIPVTFLTECHHILHVLGPWCAGRIAGSFIKPLTRLEEFERNDLSKKFLSLTLTLMRFMDQIVEDMYDNQVQCLEDFHTFTSPKALMLFQTLQEYKPDDNFTIIGDDGMDMESLGSDDDSLNLSDSEADVDKKKENNVHYVAVKRVQPETSSPTKVEDVICGIVFVERRHTAFALNLLLEELCNWDPDLYFIKSHHITAAMSTMANENDAFYKTQEDILRKFRRKELNLLISTNALEEGVDIPKCNLIIRFDLPRDFRSYVQSKGRARASKSKYYMLVDHLAAEYFHDNLKIFKGIEKILVSKCHSRELSSLEPEEGEENTEELMDFYAPTEDIDGPRVTMKTAMTLVNQYCAKLPSDAFTHLTPKCTVEDIQDSGGTQYIATLQLPINSPIKEPIQGKPMATKKLAKMSVALIACQILHKSGELDNNLQPVGKEIIKYEDESNEWEEAELHGQARPGTTKRKQYYHKRLARPLLGIPQEGATCYLYRFNLMLTCPITDEQNTRGRKIHAPEGSPRGFGIISKQRIPLVPQFPVFTRSGEVTVSLDLVSTQGAYSSTQLADMRKFHCFVFANVLRLEKEPMLFDPDKAEISYIVVPLVDDNGEVVIDWDFMKEVDDCPIKRCQRKYLFQAKKTKFKFREEDFIDAVVMPSYRNIDQPQYFYVAEIRSDLNAKSKFPSPELYDTFEHYYRSKYGLELTNMEQPLLDVDHTSARLNLLTPRYMNQKGVALPTSSAETRRARRENLQQKQILLPELCDIHPFPASLWRKAVCIPAILYRVNYLLIAEELRLLIARQAHIGLAEIPADHRFPDLEFAFSTNASEKASNGEDSTESSEAIKALPLEITELDQSSGDQDNDQTQDPTTVEKLSNGPACSANDNVDEEMHATGNSLKPTTIEDDLQIVNSPGTTVKERKTSDTDANVPVTDNDTKKNNSESDDHQVISQETEPLTAALTQCNCKCKDSVKDECISSQSNEQLCPDEQGPNDFANCAGHKSPCRPSVEIDVSSTSKTDHLNSPIQEQSSSLQDSNTSVDTEKLQTDSDPSSVWEKCSNFHENDDQIATTNESQASVISNSPEQVESSTSVKDQSKDEAEGGHEVSYPMIIFDIAVDLATFIGPSPCTILQALTMSNANDFFNLERLETIGDSFLKFAITVYLYCSYPGIHEGKLSYLRSKQVSNYNLYKLGKKTKLPECMVAAKFEPTENWLPPGYVVKEDGAYKGLSVHITSLIDAQESSEKQDFDGDSGTKEQYQNGKIGPPKLNGDSDALVDSSSSILYSISKKEQEQFVKELKEVTNVDDGEKTDCSQILKKLIPYNLQTQHSLPDKSIADCVEALIGCYLTTCGQMAALQLMSWLGLKVIPERSTREENRKNASENVVASFGYLQAPMSPLLKHVPDAVDVLESHLEGFKQFEKTIQYTFRDRSYLLQAFTHASYHYNIVTDCYQRLEFLGDAILDYVITRHLFDDSKKHSPGILTDLRSALVNNNIFAALAVKWDFHKYFKAVSPQLFNVIDKFVSWQKDKDDEIGLDEFNDEDDDIDEDDMQVSEDIEIPKALGDIFESVAGAIYLDSGMSLDTVWRVYYRMMQPQIDAFTEEIPKSPVRELLEMEPETAKFEKSERTMNGRIRVKVNVVGKGCFYGIGRNYRIAKSAAARRALKLIKQYQQHIENQMLAAEKYKAICS